MSTRENEERSVCENNLVYTNAWASEVINVLLTSLENTEIPMGYAIDGISLQPQSKGKVSITFTFKGEER